MNKDAINQRIQALEAELAGLKEELNKPTNFTFNYEKGKTIRVAEVCTYDTQMCDNNRYLDNFRYRKTRSNAEKDLKLQKELMCIGALAEQLDPDYKSKVIWDNKTYNSYIAYSVVTHIYYVNSCYNRLLGIVYMPKDLAEKVCEILNNKGVEL